MNKRLISIINSVLLLFFFGCSMKGTIKEDYIELKVGEQMTARRGDVFFAQRDNPATVRRELSFNLTVLKLSDREIILKMVKYNGLDNNSRKKQKKVRLTPKASVKTFTYPLSEKNIKFQGFAFRILKVEGGAISYKRLH